MVPMLGEGGLRTISENGRRIRESVANHTLPATFCATPTRQHAALRLTNGFVVVCASGRSPNTPHEMSSPQMDVILGVRAATVP